MGEAAPCLMRSVSQPLFASCEFREGDPLRALTTSISFGRFMTEPLDWEKWSSFSHNRTLEDVKKYSRPGAVAEKKAFFEAYYKKFAATKKSAKSPKKENKPPNHSPHTYITTDIGPVNISNTRKNESPTLATDENTPSSNLVSSKIRNVDDIISSTGETEREITSTKDGFSPSTNIVFSESGNVDKDKGPNRVHEMEMTSNEDVCSHSTTDLVSSEIGNADDIFPSTFQSMDQVEQEKSSTNIVFPESGNFEDTMPSNRGAEMEITSNEDVCLPTTLVSSKIRNVDEIISSTGQVEPSTNLVFSQIGDKKRQVKDKISGQKKPEISSSVSGKASAPAIRPWKAAKAEMEKKRSASQSLHMSMNFPLQNKSRTSKTLTQPKERCSEVPPTRVLSGNGVKKNSQVLLRVENKRSKPLLDSSFHGNKTDVVKSLSINFSEASTACTKKPRSTIPWSFSFRSEQRAAKRKEFFQKLEEKGNINTTKKIQFQPKLKDKARNDNKKLRCSTALEAKSNTSGAKGPSNSIQKVPSTRSCLPELGRKPTTRLVEDACYQSPPQRPSSKPKNFIEINKKKLTSLMASLPSKKRHDIQK